MLAVLVGDAGEEFDGDALGEGIRVLGGVLGEGSPAFGVLLDEDAEGAVLAAAASEVDVNDLEAVGGGDAVGGGADCVEGQGHVNSRG